MKKILLLTSSELVNNFFDLVIKQLTQKSSLTRCKNLQEATNLPSQANFDMIIIDQPHRLSLIPSIEHENVMKNFRKTTNIILLNSKKYPDLPPEFSTISFTRQITKPLAAIELHDLLLQPHLIIGEKNE